MFSRISSGRASHCYEGRKFSGMGKRVAVIGAGQSALESAAIFHEMGIDVEVIARIQELRWIGMHPRLHQLGPISNVLDSKHDVGPIGRAASSPIPTLCTTFRWGLRTGSVPARSVCRRSVAHSAA